MARSLNIEIVDWCATTHTFHTSITYTQSILDIFSISNPTKSSQYRPHWVHLIFFILQTFHDLALNLNFLSYQISHKFLSFEIAKGYTSSAKWWTEDGGKRVEKSYLRLVFLKYIRIGDRKAEERNLWVKFSR